MSKGPEYGTPRNRRQSEFIYRLWNAAQVRSRKRGTLFTITREWVMDKVDEGCCAVSGVPFCYEFTGEGKQKRRPFAPSLDQINPGKGYTPENTQVVVSIYNYAKNNFEHEDVLRLSHALILAQARQSHE